MRWLLWWLLILWFILIVAVQISLAGVITGQCSSLSPNIYYDMTLSVSNSTQQTCFLMTNKESREIVLTSTPLSQVIHGLSDASGTMSVCLASPSGNPALSGVSCSLHNGEYYSAVLALAGLAFGFLVFKGILDAL